MAHIIPAGSRDILVRARSDKGFWNADVVDLNYGFDIAFLGIRKESENPSHVDVVFSHSQLCE